MHEIVAFGKEEGCKVNGNEIFRPNNDLIANTMHLNDSFLRLLQQ